MPFPEPFVSGSECSGGVAADAGSGPADAGGEATDAGAGPANSGGGSAFSDSDWRRRIFAASRSRSFLHFRFSSRSSWIKRLASCNCRIGHLFTIDAFVYIYNRLWESIQYKTNEYILYNRGEAFNTFDIVKVCIYATLIPN